MSAPVQSQRAGAHQPSSNGALQSDAHGPTPEGREDARRVLQEYMHMREAVLSSQIVQEDFARTQAEMRAAYSRMVAMQGMQLSAPAGRHDMSQSPTPIFDSILGRLDQAPPLLDDLPVPDSANMTPTWAPVLGETAPDRGSIPMRRDFGVSDAMVGTEVASLVLQSPLWNMLSPSLTGRSNRRRAVSYTHLTLPTILLV